MSRENEKIQFVLRYKDQPKERIILALALAKILHKHPLEILVEIAASELDYNQIRAMEVYGTDVETSQKQGGSDPDPRP